MLIELRDGKWTNLQDINEMYVGRAKILETGEIKWHVIIERGEYHNVSTSETFETREEAKAFAKKIVDQLNTQK